ncbi:right-handed parallel beta-helix repeat-containing protein [bacterium]|nr:right-handed parallel beta-helix repeat-containing protein [bacterium]
MNRQKLIPVIFIVLMITGSSLADVHVEGEVSGTWTLEDSPYFVDGAITLGVNDTLVIEPGVLVRFTGRYGFLISGVLLAVGTEENSIFFNPSTASPDSWLGLEFYDRRADASRLEYCSIVYAFTGIILDGASPAITNSNISRHSNGGMEIEDSNGLVENCTFTSIGGTGIAISGRSNPLISGCLISDCNNKGITVSSGVTATIIDNVITRTVNHGIHLRDASACNLIGNRITECGERGIWVEQTNNIQIVRNIVALNGSHGIYLFRCEGALLLNNTIRFNENSGLYFYTSQSEVTGNIVQQQANNNSDAIFGQSFNGTLSYNCVYAPSGDEYAGINPGGHDINENPLLDDDYIPEEESPVIDAGDPRYRDPDDTISDIGARFFNQNLPPVIITTSPEPFAELDGDSTVEFSIYAEDPNGHDISYTWFVNDEEVGGGNIIDIHFNRNGDYIVMALVDDGYYMGQVTHEWTFSGINMFAPGLDPELPGSFTLHTPYPNPFNSTARFSIDAGRVGIVNISIFDLNGRMVETIWNGRIIPGQSSFIIDGANLPAGSYIIVARTNSLRTTQRVTLIK